MPPRVLPRRAVVVVVAGMWTGYFVTNACALFTLTPAFLLLVRALLVQPVGRECLHWHELVAIRVLVDVLVH